MPFQMAQATVPAARRALAAAGMSITEMRAIKTHNPFAVNDLSFGREFSLSRYSFNHFGSSLIFGQPQGPTSMCLIIELIEELVLHGGGSGLFVGCAVGDTGAAIVIQVNKA